MDSFKVTRIYTDDAGDSRFEELHYPLHSEGIIGALSDKVEVKDMIFRTAEPAYDYNFFTTPHTNSL